MEKFFRLKSHPDGRLTLVPYYPPPPKIRLGRGGGRPPKKDGLMTFGEYRQTLRRWLREDLDNRVIDPNLSRWVCLTLASDLGWEDFVKNLNRFMTAVSRAFPDTEYLRAIEMNPEPWKFHAHIIFCFPAEIPKSFTRDWVTKNWKCGRCSVDPVRRDYQGLFVYVTLEYKNKKDGKVPKDEDLTRFPKGARVITKSRNFGKVVVPTEELITRAEALAIISESQKKGSGYRVHENKHYFVDQTTGQIGSCLDRVYIRESENKIKNKEIEK